MSQSYIWPSQSASANASVGANGSPSPSSATLVAGQNPSGNLQPLQTDNAGDLYVNINGSSGGAVPTNITEVGGVAITLGQKLEAASFPVVIASDQSTIPISAASLPLPAGASTSALQTSGNSSLSSILDNQTNGTQVTSVNNFPATQPVSGTVTVVQPTGSNLHADIDSSALPTGASTAANQATIIANQTNGTQTAVVSQPTAANLNATVVGTVTANAGSGTFAISAVSLPLPTGASTSANQATVIANQTNGTQKVLSYAATPAPLTIYNGALTVGTSPVRLTVSGSAPAGTRVTMVATPDPASAANFYVGSATVAVGTGPAVKAGQVIIANNDAGDYYIISDTIAQTVEIMEQY